MGASWLTAATAASAAAGAAAAEAAAGADVVFVAVPVGAIADAVIESLDAGANVVTDVGSVKLPVVATGVGDVPAMVSDDNRPLIVDPDDEPARGEVGNEILQERRLAAAIENDG